MSIAAVSPVFPSAGAQSSSSQPRQPPVAELPDAPKPVTPANAAVHIMNVPTSRVVEAFALLQRAAGQQQAATAPMPQRLPAALAPAPPPRRSIDLEA
jgi:hypothetical protein